MPGPCPGGISTAKLHRDAKCNDRERCTGPGCRVYRPKREAQPAADAARCFEHGDALVWEEGGPDMPTIHGRHYCPTCQVALGDVLTELFE